MKCDVCGDEGATEVRCSTTGGIGFRYCDQCLASGREPWGAIVACLVGVLRDPPSMDDIGEWFQPIIEIALEAEEKTQEELFAEVLAFEREYEQAMREV